MAKTRRENQSKPATVMEPPTVATVEPKPMVGERCPRCGSAKHLARQKINQVEHAGETISWYRVVCECGQARNQKFVEKVTN